MPPIPGLAEAGYWTNREALQADRLPERLVVIGAGPIGLELGQVFHRFGSRAASGSAAVAILVGSVGYLGAQLLALGLGLDPLGLGGALGR